VRDDDNIMVVKGVGDQGQSLPGRWGGSIHILCCRVGLRDGYPAEIVETPVPGRLPVCYPASSV
jgi:hypothetical protein